METAFDEDAILLASRVPGWTTAQPFGRSIEKQHQSSIKAASKQQRQKSGRTRRSADPTSRDRGGTHAVAGDEKLQSRVIVTGCNHGGRSRFLARLHRYLHWRAIRQDRRTSRIRRIRRIRRTDEPSVFLIESRKACCAVMKSAADGLLGDDLIWRLLHQI